MTGETRARSEESFEESTETNSKPTVTAAELGIPPWTDFYTEADLQSAIKIFSLYAEHDDYLRHAATNPDIARLFQAAQQTMAPSKEDMRNRRKRRKQDKRDKDKEVLAVSGIRQMRKVKMVGYSGGSVDIPKPPRRGTIEANEAFAQEDETRITTDMTGSTSESVVPMDTSVDDPAKAESVEGTTAGAEESTEGQPGYRKLTYLRNCHVCGKQFRDLHHFYDQLCPTCAEFNFQKRFSEADMKGRVCIVTGARVKIGYCIALKLLRMGATVIVTTRFPHDAANRYAKEPDFPSFEGRLAVYGIDFRDIPLIHHFCRHVQERYQRLDAIINNAAQTVRKPPAYYEHLITGEGERISPEIQKAIDVVDVYRSRSGDFIFGHGGGQALPASEAAKIQEITEDKAGVRTVGVALPAKQATAHLPEVNMSAALSQMALVQGDAASAVAKAKEFPPGLYDRDDQQIDMRRENSWTQELGDISTVEMMECHVINTFAPWILISELKPLMERSAPLDGAEGPCDKFVVNVSAMEGQFYRNKTIYHPHTNMAKAALNMMTRTASAGMAALNIFMTAVDTGWITDENPVDQWHKREHAPPPLDEWDAAMRVLDPVLCGVRGEEKLWGVFLKNYYPTRW
ncbi:hypothetical protein DFS34DRAFT_609553 [Phlyctochytrium arcticum]|nr:hypothetical protein DFS34DRAFT_609553 [Phlyctochytrium arcticum]